MNWFLIALIGPFLYALTNYIDKILLEKYFKNGGVGTILIFSGLLSIVALPFLYLADPTVIQVSYIHILVLSVVSILNILVLFFYLKAIEGEEVSIAIIFYQLVPIFAYGLGYLILNETLTLFQIAAILIIILGTSIVSFEVDADNRFRLRKKTVFYMLAASFCWALGAVIFKAVALEEQVIRSLFWEHLVLLLIGLILLLVIRSYRNQFIKTVTTNSIPVLSLTLLNEAIYIGGNVIMAFTYLLGPVSVVLLANSYQSLFALIIGAFLTIFLPKAGTEKLHLKNLWQKALSILITAIGTYLLFYS